MEQEYYLTKGSLVVPLVETEGDSTAKDILGQLMGGVAVTFGLKGHLR